MDKKQNRGKRKLKEKKKIDEDRRGSNHVTPNRLLSPNLFLPTNTNQRPRTCPIWMPNLSDPLNKQNPNKRQNYSPIIFSPYYLFIHMFILLLYYDLLSNINRVIKSQEDSGSA